MHLRYSTFTKERLFKILALGLLSLLSFSGCATSPKSKAGTGVVEQGALETKQGEASASTVAVKIIAINDLHGHLEGPSGSLLVDGEKVPAGGAQYLATEIEKLRVRYPDALFVAAGDMIGASPMLSSLFHDEPTIEALNEMKLDVTAVGNHEFDEGLEELLRMKHGGCHKEDGCKTDHEFQGATFDILAANVHEKGKDEPVLPPVVIKEVEGIPIGFIGLTLEGTPRVVSPQFTQNLTFLNEIETINRYAKDLQAKGVETIVVLLHEGGAQESEDYNACDGISGPVVKIVEGLDDAVDVVVSGHTHKAYICEINSKLVTSAKSYGQLMTEIDLVVDRKTKDVMESHAKNAPILVKSDSKTDPKVDAVIARYKSVVQPLANRPVGKFTQDITRDKLENGESLLGRIIADAQLDAAASEGAQIAMMNPGGIRDNLIYKASKGEQRPDGTMTYGQLFSIQPFSNSLVTVSLSGEQIHQLLEKQFELNRMLSISKGFSYEVGVNSEGKKYVDPSSIRLKGVVLHPSKMYRVVANSFLAAGGDGFDLFAQGTNRVIGLMDVDALTQYMQKHQPLQVPMESRIILK